VCSSDLIVAVDELGIIDPADNMPSHIGIPEYVLDRISQGAVFHKEFLAVADSKTAILKHSSSEIEGVDV